MPAEDEPFKLRPYEVPDFPNSRRWVDQLRWCLAVMDHDDDDISFLASLLGHAAGDRGGLTEKQAKYAQRIVDRVVALHSAGHLACQAEDETIRAGVGLADQPPAGRA